MIRRGGGGSNAVLGIVMKAFSSRPTPVQVYNNLSGISETSFRVNPITVILHFNVENVKTGEWWTVSFVGPVTCQNQSILYQAEVRRSRQTVYNTELTGLA